MADPKLYLRPIGFLYGETAAEAVAEGAAFALAGGPISFTAAELIEGTPSSTERRLLAAKELAGSRDADLGRVLKAHHHAAPALRRARSLSPPDHGHRQRHAGLILGRWPLRQDGRRDRPCRRAWLQPAQISSMLEGSRRARAQTRSRRATSSAACSRCSRGLPGCKPQSPSTRERRCVARAAARAGAKIFNDVSALTYDPDSLAAAADTGLSVILMHAKGEPKTMHLDPRYDDVVLEVYDYLEGRIAAAEAAGIERARIAADPGIGFGKTMDHTLALARQSQPAAWARGAAPRRRLAQALHRRGGGRRNTAVAGARFLRRRPCGCGARCPDFARS